MTTKSHASLAACRDTGRQSSVPRAGAATLHTSKTVPRTPLEVTMAKLQQSEAEHQRDRVQMKRELDQQHKRASSLEHRHTQLQASFS